MHKLALALALVGLGACSSTGPSNGPPDAQMSSPGPDLAMMSQPDMAWSTGGCDSGTGAARQCVDYFAPAAALATLQANCHDLQTGAGTIPEHWYPNGCPHTNAAGGCHVVSAGGNSAVTTWFYMPDFTSAEVMQGCTNGTYVAP